MQCEKVEILCGRGNKKAQEEGKRVRFESTSCYLKKYSYMQLINDFRPKKGGISPLRRIESIRLCTTDEV